MPTKCKVLLSNEVVTVVDYCGVEIQLPPLEKDSDYIFIEKNGNKYNVVQKQEEHLTTEAKQTQKESKTSKRPKKNEKPVLDD